MASVQDTQQAVQMLMQTAHYAKLGPDGLFAIIQKAKSMRVEPLDALNGGMYYVKGKVEMSSAMMNQLIRQNGHSITKDKRSDDTICILHGKRADTGDTWTESFSIDEARRAGIYSEDGSWGKYPRDMLFARALSRLARQLFPDVIKGCYVQGEIADAPPLHDAPRPLTRAEIADLKKGLESFEDLRDNVIKLVNDRWDGEWEKMPRKTFDSIVARLKQRMIDESESIQEAVASEVETEGKGDGDDSADQ